MSELILPVVHRNGTSRAELLEQACDAGAAISRALNALYEAGPNQRDYYVKPGHWEKALAQHERRIETLKALLTELQAQAEGIAE